MDLDLSGGNSPSPVSWMQQPQQRQSLTDPFPVAPPRQSNSPTSQPPIASQSHQQILQPSPMFNQSAVASSQSPSSPSYNYNQSGATVMQASSPTFNQSGSSFQSLSPGSLNQSGGYAGSPQQHAGQEEGNLGVAQPIRGRASPAPPAEEVRAEFLLKFVCNLFCFDTLPSCHHVGVYNHTVSVTWCKDN